MNLLNNILSSIDPTAATLAARQTPTSSTPKPIPRPTAGTNETSQVQPLKRKAEDQPGGGQVKLQRKDAPTQSDRAILATRPAGTPGITKPKAVAPLNAIPYRGTAANGGLSAARAASIAPKKPIPTARIPSASAKPTISPPKVAVATPGTAPGAAPVSTRKLGYAARLQMAAQAQQAKPAAPPVKHEVTKIFTKKEREALRAQQIAAAKGKKPSLATPGRGTGIKSELNKEKRKPADLGYQGTARPARKPVEIGYKGTARPTATPTGAAGKAGGPAAAKAKPKTGQGRLGGYVSWSDEELDKEEDEEDYDSDASSDMEGDLWDMENEEELALKAAKKEDALALKEENELRRQKQLKLAAMNKAAAAKRKY